MPNRFGWVEKRVNEHHINSVCDNNSDTYRLIIELVIIEKRLNIYVDVRYTIAHFYTNHTDGMLMNNRLLSRKIVLNQKLHSNAFQS